MDDTSPNDQRRLADGIAALLAEHKAIEPLVLDLRELNSWTDFFVIATVTSSAHLKGMHKHLKEYLRERSVEIASRRKRAASDDEWSLVDLGGIVVHLMTERARAFYDLERLWGGAVISRRAGSV